MFEGDGGTVTMARPGRKKAEEPKQTKTVRITAEAYDLLVRVAGMKLMDLGDCNSELILKYGRKELADDYQRVMKPDRPKD